MPYWILSLYLISLELVSCSTTKWWTVLETTKYDKPVKAQKFSSIGFALDCHSAFLIILSWKNRLPLSYCTWLFHMQRIHVRLMPGKTKVDLITIRLSILNKKNYNVLCALTIYILCVKFIRHDSLLKSLINVAWNLWQVEDIVGYQDPVAL